MGALVGDPRLPAAMVGGEFGPDSDVAPQSTILYKCYHSRTNDCVLREKKDLKHFFFKEAFCIMLLFVF